MATDTSSPEPATRDETDGEPVAYGIELHGRLGPYLFRSRQEVERTGYDDDQIVELFRAPVSSPERYEVQSQAVERFTDGVDREGMLREVFRVGWWARDHHGGERGALARAESAYFTGPNAPSGVDRELRALVRDMEHQLKHQRDREARQTYEEKMKHGYAADLIEEQVLPALRAALSRETGDTTDKEVDRGD